MPWTGILGITSFANSDAGSHGSSMGAIEYILLGIGAIIMAAEQGLSSAPDIRARFPQLKLPGWTKFLPIICWSIAGLLWAFGPETLPLWENPTIEGMPAYALIDEARGHTGPEIEVIFSRFKGATVRISGHVDDVLGGENESLTMVFPVERRTFHGISLVFTGDERKKANRLGKGDAFVAVCKFTGSEQPEVSLHECRL
jgi:hypothetical protein